MIYHLNKIIATTLLSIFLSFSLASSDLKTTKVKKVLKLDINSSINPATLDYLTHNFKTQMSSSDLFVIQMNTPGGLLSTTKEIISLIANSKKPVAIWIGPSGASATSAGAIIASSASILSMSEGSNIGAATPISSTGDLDKESDLRLKVINDIKALVKAQAQTHKRSHKPFEEMIEKAASFSTQEALEKKIIDFSANDIDELLKKIHQMNFQQNGKNIEIEVSNNVKIVEAQMSIGQKLLNILSSPNLAYILFLMGAALLYIELQAPGGFIAGSIGSLCLVFAAISFQVLPLNLGALGLIVLAFILLILEIYITSFGLLSIAALVSLVTGSMFLFRTVDSYLSISHSVIIATVLAISSFLALIVYVFMKSRKNIGKEKFNDQISEEGVIHDILSDGQYMIKTHGEFWKAKGPTGLNINDNVKILNKNEDMTYNIKKSHQEENI
ncbi:MAG: hypothetical protein VX341_00070 [Bdellovibrionota bacterium]|nr:hypothetical protein [Bdellovibrionota bacterium]